MTVFAAVISARARHVSFAPRLAHCVAAFCDDVRGDTLLFMRCSLTASDFSNPRVRTPIPHLVCAPPGHGDPRLPQHRLHLSPPAVSASSVVSMRHLDCLSSI